MVMKPVLSSNDPDAPRSDWIQRRVGATRRFSEDRGVRALFAGAWWHRGGDPINWNIDSQIKRDFEKRGPFVENAVRNGPNQPERTHAHE